MYKSAHVCVEITMCVCVYIYAYVYRFMYMCVYVYILRKAQLQAKILCDLSDPMINNYKGFIWWLSWGKYHTSYYN